MQSVWLLHSLGAAEHEVLYLLCTVVIVVHFRNSAQVFTRQATAIERGAKHTAIRRHLPPFLRPIYLDAECRPPRRRTTT